MSKTRTVWIVLAALWVGCGGQGGGPPAETAEDVVPEAEPPPPPVALLEGDPVSLTQYDQFTRVRMDGIRSREVAIDRIVPLLPSKLQAPYRAALGEAEKLRPLARAAYEADGAMMDCRHDGDDQDVDDCDALRDAHKAKSKKLRAARRVADERVRKLGDRIGDAIEAGGADVAILKVAEAYLSVIDANRYNIRSSVYDDDAGHVPDLPYGKLEGNAGRSQRLGTEMFEEVREQVEVGSPLAALVQYELFQRYWSAEQADDAMEELEGLLQPDVRRRVEGFLVKADGFEQELQLKRAFLFTTGEEPDHAKATAAFRQYLPHAPERGDNNRRDILSMIMMAQYRSHSFDGALATALELLAPPPTKAGARPRSVLSALRGSSIGRQGESSGARRIAADSMERLGSDADISSQPQELQSQLLNILATRALFRRDLVQAKAHADEALGMVPEGCPAARAYKTLATVAELENEPERQAELEAALEKAKGRRHCSLKSPAISRGGGILAALSGPSWDQQEHTKAHETDAEDEPSVADRRIEALSRLCLEPDHWQVHLLRDGDVSVSVKATAYDRGPAKVAVEWQPWEVVPAVTKCLEEMGTAYFSGAMESVRAEIDLEKVHRTESSIRMDREMGSLFGKQIGKNFGFGGLGLRGTGKGGGGIGRAVGIGGLGSRGSGRGGGGTGQGTIGLGNRGTIGHGGGGGSGSGYGRGSGGLRGRRTKVPALRFGTITARGRLSVEVIRRILRRHINMYRYCYEQQLTRHPGLAGQVTTEFVISASGSVTSARVTSSTLSNAAVEACLTRAVRRAAYPQPEGGGTVTVTFPLTFALAN